MKYALLAALLAAGCATAAPATPPPPAAAAVERLPNDVHWTRVAAEHRAIFLQTYRFAGERLRTLAAGRAAGSWAVILDADETVLDNSEYQRRLALRGARYDTATWNAWVREIAAAALPGSAEFVALVRQLGGRAVIVTNRDAVVCDETRRNFVALRITVDAVLCQSAGESGKNDRFRAVAQGTTGTGLPALEVLMFIGDNIQDFPSTTQALRDADAPAYARFGDSWFVLPNPMYGSWERVPAR